MIQRYRSASERVNSIIKEDLKIIDRPIVYNKQRADILAQIAASIAFFTNSLLTDLELSNTLTLLRPTSLVNN